MSREIAKRAVRKRDEKAFKQVQNVLKRKISRLSSQGVGSANAYFPYSIERLDSLLNGDPVDIFGREVEIKYSLGKKEEKTLWYEDIPLEVVRDEDRIIFENPFNQKIESWSKLFYLTRKYNKHLPFSKKSEDASKYLGSVNPETLEKKVFNEGSGFIQNPGTIFLYGVFDNDIGILKVKDNDKTNALRLMVERFKKSYGTYTRVHGYPVSYEEIREDCPKDLQDVIMYNKLSSA